MNIRPKNIPKFETGGVPQWYLDRYGNRTSLLGWDRNKRYNFANQNLNTNDHRNAGNLDIVYSKNTAYTGTPGAVSSDIQAFYNSDGNGMSALDFVDFYNKNAGIIRSHWAQDLTYNAKTAGTHNRLFRRMFQSRSNQSQSPGSAYNIGYQDDLDNIEGSSTWLRRMDQYENEFDENNPDSNRLHEITLKDGSKALVYKKANGDIGLFNKQTSLETPPTTTKDTKSTQIIPQHREKYGFDWSKLGKGLLKVFSNPDILAAGRLAGNLINNGRVYDELLKGINPDLKSSYHTHRQVVGDEATKQAYYRRAVLGELRAAKPFTSDADRQIAYLMEAKRIGDELRAQGDLADNQEIRRTSDESNQHQWANTLRDTEVANVNRASINQANALRHNLLALKHSALWSSIDNFLLGIEYRKRQQLAQQEALDNLIFLLQLQLALLDDPRITNALKEFLAVLDRHKLSDGRYDTDNEEVLAAKRKYLSLLNQIAIEQYLKRKEYYLNRGTLFGKSGTKITYKKKDDLLYKSAKDVVEHFRKMSKMSSDALNRKKPKIEKLAPHPKGSTKKYLLGGVAPFTIYKPVALGGETTTATETSSTNTTSKSSKEGYELDLLKELFKSLLTEGLPSDVNGIFLAMNALMQRSQLFGTELSASDIQNMYLQLMLKLNAIKFNKALYDKVLEIVNSKDAGSEFAVDLYGRIAVQDQEGKVSYIKWSELEKNFDKYNPLRNSDLLSLRAYSPDLAFNASILQVASNATSMSEIAKFLKGLLPSIGLSEKTIEGYTKLDSNLIKAGLQILKDAPAGDYKFSEYTKDLLKQAQMALNYLKGILPKNMKTLLQVNSEMLGISSDALIASMVSSTLDSSYKFEVDAVTGKASKDDTDSLDKVSSNPLLAMMREIGGVPTNYSLITRDSNIRMSVNGTAYPSLPKVKEDMSINQMLNVSGIDGIITNRRGITFGDLQIKPEDLNHIMYSNDGGGTVVTLPCKIINGVKQVNLDVRDAYERAEQKALEVSKDRTSPTFIKALGEALQKEHLDSLLDSNGLPNKNMFALFLLVEGYTTDKIDFRHDSQYVEKVNNPDELLEARMTKALSTDKKKPDYDLDVKDHWSIFEGFYDDIYRGTIFIPLNNNPNAAINSWGGSVNVSLSTELEELYLTANKSSNFNKNNSL